MRSEASLARAVSFPRVINVDDLRRLARRRLPAVVFAYIDGGAEDEVTLRENVDAFRAITFRPRQCVAVPKCDLRTTVLGTELSVPFMLAPVGFCRMFYPRGEFVAAREAGAAGTGYILSTFSGTRLEEVRQGTSGPLWYQLYVPGGRGVAEATIARAKAAGYTALVVTIDTPVAGMRERDFRHGVRHLLQGKFWASVPHSGQFITRPRWVMDFLADGAPRVFPNVELPDVGPMPCGDVGALLEQTLVTWDDLRWMHDAWKGTLIVKGVHTGDDARRAIDAGANASLAARGPLGRQRSDRSADGWRHPPWRRHRQSAVPGCARGVDRTSVRLWVRRGGRPRRRAGHRDPADRPGANDEAARVRGDHEAGSLVC